MANGTNTTSVIASCRILSCGRFISVKPIRFAGTCSRYSNSAMPQLTSAAIHHGFDDSSLRWAYQANVMKKFDATSNPAHMATVEKCIRASFGPSDQRRPEGTSLPDRGPESKPAALFRATGRARRRVGACGGGERPAPADG